jgi:hypothetical protein
VERQAVLAEALRQYLQHATGVLFTGEAHDEVVRVAYQESASLQPGLHLLLEPHVQHVVQVDVGQQR